MKSLWILTVKKWEKYSKYFINQQLLINNSNNMF